MKLRLLLATLVLGLAPASLPAQGTPAAAEAAPLAEQLNNDITAVVNKVTAKLKTGARTAEALAPELAEFDALAVKYAANKEAAGTVAFVKATLYLQVFRDEAKGKELLLAVKNDCPGTEAAATAERILEQLSPEAKAKAAARAEAAAAERAAKFAALVGQPAPELHFNWSSKEGLKTLSGLKGQVVVLDFWATWCGPCIGSFPQVREHVTHFKGTPVTFLGVTSIQGYVANMGPRIDTKGDPAREMALMPEFMKAKEMTWDVAFSEEQVFNPDYGISGIPFVAIIAPDGTIRHAGLHPGDPAADIAGKVEALLREFKRPLPAKS